MKKNNLLKTSALLMAASMLLTACTTTNAGDSNNQDAENSPSSSSAVVETDTQSEEDSGIFTPNGEYPIVKEGEELVVSVFAPLRVGIESYELNEQTLWFQEKTGITLEWIAVNSSDRVTKQNAMLNSDTYTDVMLDTYFSASEQLLYGQQGIIVPLNDLIAEYGPNVQNSFDNNPVIADTMTLSDGNIYGLPIFGEYAVNVAPNKMYVNTVWLDNLGLEIPTTTQEYEDMLYAFINDDPNQNGEKDEIGLIGSTNGWNTNPNTFLLNSFTMYNAGQSNDMYVDNGKIVYTRTTDEYKEGLKYLNSLFTQGLMDSGTYSLTTDSVMTLANQEGDNVIGAFTSGHQATFFNVGDTRWQDYTAISPLEGPDGVRYAFNNPTLGQCVFVITDKCQEPEAVMRAWDILHTEEGFMRNVYGVYGVDYIDAEEGMLNRVGGEATYTMLTEVGERGERSWNQLTTHTYIPDHDLLWSADENDLQTQLYQDTMDNYVDYLQPVEMILPSLSYDVEAAAEIALLEVELDTYINASVIDFITGNLNFEEDWNEYLEYVQDLGVERYVELVQAAYDAN